MREKHSMPGLILGAVGLLAAASLHGYPISPVPLWQLVERAELIVTAEVVDVELDQSVGDDLDVALAVLKVHESWKGRSPTRLRVSFPARLVCPAPPRYVEGETVLAFLTPFKRRWVTVGLSYGTLYPTRGELDDYRELVKQAVDLQQRPRVETADRIEWLVEAAARPGTRWHGLYELHPKSDGVHAYYDQEERPTASARLERRHLEAIAAGFVADPVPDRTLIMALATLAGIEDDGVDRAAVSAIETLLALDRPPWWLREAMLLTLERFGDPDPAGRVATLGEGAIDPERARALWRAARFELTIPDVEPTPWPEGEVWGVGGTTPD